MAHFIMTLVEKKLILRIIYVYPDFNLRWKSHLWILTELMDTSLDRFFRKAAQISHLKIPEYIFAFIAKSVLHGLIYLNQLKILHRDVKPSNILTCARDGCIKLCDFGISGFTQNSICRSFIGFQIYMAVSSQNDR